MLLSLCIPAFLLIFIFMIIPLGNAVRVSFFKWNGYSQEMKWVGLENYGSIFKDKVFIRSTMNTFIYGFGSTLLQNIFSDHSAPAEACDGHQADHDRCGNLEQLCYAHLPVDQHKQGHGDPDGAEAFYTAYGSVQNVPLACAECAVALAPVILLYLLLQKYIIEGQLDSVSK